MQSTMMDFFLSFDVGTHFAAFILGSTRLAVFLSTAPFLGGQVIGMSARSAVVLALYLVLHPVMLEAVSPLLPLAGETGLFFGALVLKEVFIGFVLGWMAGLIFRAVESAGIFIDNQRGAATAQQTDPLSGEMSSPTGSFLFQSTVYAFFASGAFLTFLVLIYGTYECWPAGEMLPAAMFAKPGAALFFGEALSKMMTGVVLISAPVVLACLFTDAALGLINRFAPQLNVYILAMPIKSAMASFLLIFYFALLMTDAPERFAAFGLDVSALKMWFE